MIPEVKHRFDIEVNVKTGKWCGLVHAQGHCLMIVDGLLYIDAYMTDETNSHIRYMSGEDLTMR